MPTQATGSAQMQYCAVVDGGNFVRLGRFHSTCTSAKIHLEAQEAIIVSKLGVISSVKYGCEISVSKFVNCKSFHRVCSIRNIVLVTSMYKFTESHPSHSHQRCIQDWQASQAIVQISSLRKVVLMKHRISAVGLGTVN